MTDTKYSVSSTGAIENGFNTDDVLSAFVKLFGISEKSALKYVGQSKLVKKDLTLQQAEIYRKKLEKIGLSIAIVEDQSGEILTPPAKSPVAPAIASATEEKRKVEESKNQSSNDMFSLLPADSPGSKSSSAFCCPKCELEQEKREQCTSCGIFFEKYFASNIAAESSNPGSTRTSKTDKSPVIGKSPDRAIIDDTDNEFAPVSLLFVVVVAILCAFVWKWIAVGLGYEFGFVAWGIGGAIGATAVMLGSQGDLSGVGCAALALLAILGGKYMFVTDYIAEIELAFSSGNIEEYIQQAYDESEEERLAFAKIDKNNNLSIAKFMVEFNYSDARSAAFVSKNDLEEFKEYTLPWLEEDSGLFDISSREIEAATPELAAAFEDVSPLSLVFESMGLLDYIFLFFGISTAYGLGRNGFNHS